MLLGVDLGSSWRWLVGGRHLSAVQWRRLGVRLHSVTVLSGSVVLLRSTVILVVDDALHLRFEARALVPRDKPLVVCQRGEALLHPTLSVDVASDKPQKENAHEDSEDDIFDDHAFLRIPEGVVGEFIIVSPEDWIVVVVVLARQNHGVVRRKRRWVVEIWGILKNKKRKKRETR